MKLFRLIFIIIILVSLSLIALPVQLCAAGYPLDEDDERILAALDYLRDPASDESLWSGGEKTCYAIVAVAACGEDPRDYVDNNGDSLLDIIEEGVDAYLKPKASASLAHEYYLMAIVAAGENPWDFGGVNVAAQLLDLFDEDESQFGQTGIINDDFWAIISLVGAGVDPGHDIIQAARDFIIDNQNNDGGWGSSISGSGEESNSDPCDTANAIMALIAAGEDSDSDVIEDAFDYIRSMQNDDGGFPYQHSTTSSDIASDARVISAVRAAGDDPTGSEWESDEGRSPFDHALSVQQDDGGFAWVESETSDGWMTTYILPALVGRYWPVEIMEDNQAPEIESVSPDDGDSTTSRTPKIYVGYSDDLTGLDAGSLSLIVDDADITGEASVADSKISYTPSSSLSKGSHTVYVEMADWAGNVVDYEWSFTIKSSSGGGGGGGGGGSSSSRDTSPPVINSFTPEKDAELTGFIPEISLTFSDSRSGIKTSSIKLVFDGADVTAEAAVTASQVTYIPAFELASGLHNVSFTVSDGSGNSITHNWSFTIQEPPPPPPATPEPEITPEEIVTPVPEILAPETPVVEKTQAAPAPLSEFAARLDAGGRLTADYVVTSKDKMLELSFASGTLTLDAEARPLPDVTIAVEENPPQPDEGWCRIGQAYRIGPAGASFDQPVRVVFSYRESSSDNLIRWDTNCDGSLDLLDKKRATAPGDFRIACRNEQEGQWDLLDGTVDREARTVTAEVSHFSQYALMGPDALPLNVVSVDARPAGITLGEKLTVSVVVENPGKGRGTYVVPLEIDGYIEDSREVTLEPGKSTLSFAHLEPYTGSHTARVLGLEAEFTVEKAAEAPSGKWWDSVDVIFFTYIGGGLLFVAFIVTVVVVARIRRKK